MSRAFFQTVNSPQLIVFCLSLCLLSTHARAGDYEDGLSAYIDGEYIQAQQYWLKAANDKHAKSMFNLGLLHEQRKLDNASIDKALNWYRLSAENGYPPAGYHLAQRMLERGGSDDKAISLITRAANAGYAPAIRYLGPNFGLANAKANQPKLSPKSVSIDQADSQTIAYQSEDWINRQRGQNWTIQLLAFKGKDQVLNFINDHSIQDNAAYFTESSGRETLYKLVYGSFDSKDKATFARQNLSASLKEYGPWLRTWASIQKVTKR